MSVQEASVTTLVAKDIRVNPDSLRKVNREGAEYQELLHSVKKNGVLNAICVREMADENGTYFELIEGGHRLQATLDAGIAHIPATVRQNVTDTEVLGLQIIGNGKVVRTRPAEFAHGISRYLEAKDSSMTIQQLAENLSVSPEWIRKTMTLKSLIPDAANLVDSGRMCVSNAYFLATLPEEEQAELLMQATTDKAEVFGPTVVARRKAIRDAKNAAREASGPAAFSPTMICRSGSELKQEAADFESGTLKCENEQELAGWKKAILWAVRFDEAGQAEQLQKHQEREAANKASAALRKQATEIAKKKADEARAAFMKEHEPVAAE